MTEFVKRTWVRVDIDRILGNYKKIKELLAPTVQVMAVVKADAYGHGAPVVARALEEAGADYFGVSSIDEAVQLRRSGIAGRILILGYTPPEHTGLLLEHRVTQTVFSYEYAERLARETKRFGKLLPVHVKLDTGMSRLGFLYQDETMHAAALDEIERTAQLPELALEGFFTHFAAADEPKSEFTERQFALFLHAAEELEDRGVVFPIRHCCNSAAMLNFPQMHLDMVRPGIVLYGLRPAASMELDPAFRPAMQLKTVVSQLKTVDAGRTVSYGRIYTTPRETELATLPIGYADGFGRLLSNNAEVLVRGRRASVVGRVCMDQCMADVTGLGVRFGDVVTLFGEDGGAQLSVDELAEKVETINYEVVCQIGKRVPRLYYQNGIESGHMSYLE